MKKRTRNLLIGGGVLVIAIFFIIQLLGSKSATIDESKIVAVDYGIEYFEVPDMEQVYINGVVQPEQTESFSKDNKMTSTPEIKVSNGDIVEEGTELFVYEDKEITSELETQKNTLTKLATQRQNIYNKWNRAINDYNKTPEEERSTSATAIDAEYQGLVDNVDEEVLFSNQTIADLSAKQFISTTAKFKGRVTIPETKDENAPILRLTAEGLYVSGKVNEKDLQKIAVGQTATLLAVSSGASVAGKITYIDDNPPESNVSASAVSNESNSSGTMSTYDVKLSLDSLDGIKNGYHMQATINLTDSQPVSVPKKALHEEEGKRYVLVNDFGSVIRREVKISEENDEICTIEFGLESGDRIIVSSEKELNEGDLIGDNGETAGSEVVIEERTSQK